MRTGRETRPGGSKTENTNTRRGTINVKGNIRHTLRHVLDVGTGKEQT